MLTSRELQSYLWEAANILRGSAVDRTDWKGYILPLLFFKRISDCWDEETAEAAELYGDADPGHFEEIHRFQLPDGCHWNDVRSTAQNVGTALKHAVQEIERANPDTRQVMEAVCTVGQYNLVAMYLNSLGVQFEEGFEGFPVR